MTWVDAVVLYGAAGTFTAILVSPLWGFQWLTVPLFWPLVWLAWLANV